MENKVGVQTSKYIQQDCHLTITNMCINHNCGKRVLGPPDRNICCVDNGGTMEWGGVGIMKYSHVDPSWLYPLPSEALREKTQSMMEKFLICNGLTCELEIAT